MSDTYSKEVSLPYESFDVFDRMLPSKYLSLFQDAAGEHAQLLGCGYEEMKDRGLMWIIARSRLDVFAEPKENDRVTITTRVKRPSGLIFEREYRATESESGTLLATGISSWCVSDIETRKLARPSSIPYPDTFEGPYDYSIHLSAIREFDTAGMDPVLVRRVNFTDLDHNRHMNNCRYADVLIDALRPAEGLSMKYLEIDFERECVEGEELSIYVNDADEKGERTALAFRRDGQLSFKARFTLA